MANKATECMKEIYRYIGEETSNTLKSLSKEDWAWFKSYNIDHHTSYFIKGSKEKLKNFEAMLLSKASYDKPLYKKFQLYEYVKSTSFDEQDTSDYTSDLIILYAHNKRMGTGNTEPWAFTSLIEKVAERNRSKMNTIILSERNIDDIEKSGELKVVDLGGWTNVKSRAEVVKELLNKKNSEKGDTPSDKSTEENSEDQVVKVQNKVGQKDIAY